MKELTYREMPNAAISCRRQMRDIVATKIVELEGALRRTEMNFTLYYKLCKLRAWKETITPFTSDYLTRGR